jgi:hypothetical protein
MLSRMPFALFATGVIGAGLFAAIMSANAQQPPAAPPASVQPIPAAPPAQAPRPQISNQDRAAFLDARIAALHAGLTLTPDQDKLWPAVETAMRDAAKAMDTQREKMHEEPRPSDPVAWLRRLSDNTTTRSEMLKKLVDASQPLYASLNDEQKHRLPILLHAIRPHMHRRFAMAESRPGMDHRPGMGMDRGGIGRPGHGEGRGEGRDGGPDRGQGGWWNR